MKENKKTILQLLHAFFKMVPAKDRIFMALFCSSNFEEISQSAMVSPAQTSRLLRRMERRGLVRGICEKRAARGKPRKIWKLTDDGLLASYSVLSAWGAFALFMLETLVEDNFDFASLVLGEYFKTFKKYEIPIFIKSYGKPKWGHPTIKKSTRVRKIPLIKFNCPIKDSKTPTFVRSCLKYPCSQNLIIISRKWAICVFGSMNKRAYRQYIKNLWNNLVYFYLNKIALMQMRRHQS